ncbi:endo-1,4-beta-xylanase [Luteolibacter yonseiensis]|uniref:endo-1,4-beta-xylanase n=1 Tax=Luteolibacter yonseiensis TaxID=1144680 RepID=A0A934R1X6_9BACT|nr:endo-1,4-beta-xylanase [Luteolibacter yonseiensis]MBK1815456.1 endo-1,4-beta-xylanase [Luteolibacter yonseiensis]
MRLIPFILMMAASFCPAVEIPAGGVELITTQEKTTAWTGTVGHAEKVSVDGQDFSQAMRITVDKASPEQPWNAQLATPLTTGPVKSGDKLLITYMARCPVEKEGLAMAKVQLKTPPHDMLGITENARIGTAWQAVHQVIVAKLDAPEGTAELAIFLGEQTQTVEIANVRVLNYGPDFDITKLPRQKDTYEGRGPGAPWRKAALERIESIRKADFSIRLRGKDGAPLANTAVEIELDRHEFGFGTCVTRGMLTMEGPDGDRYRDIVRRTCSRVVFENDLKPDTFPHDTQGKAELEKSMAWLEANGISIRGHYLMQEAVDGWTRERLADPAKAREALLASSRERIAAIGDRVTEWDVINHPIAWKGAEMLGQKGPPLDGVGMEIFREARQLTNLPLCINEDQIFRPGPQQDKTYELLEKLKRDGVRVDGLGNQAHFHSSYLPSPEELLRVTDHFTSVVPKQVITEFDIATNGDDQLAADYLRDSMIACFSHPAYDGFLLWGFWENRHWIPEAALWKKDWTPKPAALVWEEWLCENWHTKETLVSDADGRVSWRGFKGSYKVKTGARVTAPFQPGKTSEIVIPD